MRLTTYLALAAIVLLATLNFGVLGGAAGQSWLLVSTDMTMVWARFVMIGVLGVALLTAIPRSLATRIVLSVAAGGAAVLAGAAVLSYGFNLIDGMILLLVAIVLATEALEVSPRPTAAHYSPAAR